MSGTRLERYSRQMLLPQIGLEGQERLAAARIGLVGCGALGSVVAMHLARAGVGLLRVADGDYAELHNLHRQMLYTEEDVARRVPKAEAAARYLGRVNSDVLVEPVVARLEPADIPEFAAGLDLLVDGTDNFPTRFAINEYAVRRSLPWVYGGVIGTSGMSMTIVPGDGPCLRCLVHEMPGPEQSPTANVAGVMNTVVAVIASVEATEAIKLVVDADARSRDLLLLDVWDLSFDKLSVPRDPECACCAGAGKAG
jgi:molybdopterin/thiamine biosynthesis adenylyltransferase